MKLVHTGTRRAYYRGMDSGLYAAYSGLLARTQALDTAANNLANAGTVGYRAQRDYFKGVLAGNADASMPSQVGNAINNFGVLGGNKIDGGQGAITTTGNPLDLAINGPGYFSVQTSHGVQYTRAGSFGRSQDGLLQTADGEPVLDTNRQPITIPTGTINVGSDGSISVTTPDGSAIAGQLALTGFKDGDLKSLGNSRFAAAEGATPISMSTPVEQGSLEGANLDTVHGTMQLILIQRQAEMMQKALSVFNNEFDKTAAEELGRV